MAGPELFKQSTLSSKGQTTIPIEVRRLLELEEGDVLVYRVEAGSVRLEKLKRIDMQWAQAVEKTLNEWTDDADDDL